MLVHDPQPRLDEAVLRIELRSARDLTLDVQGVADPHRLLEDRVAHAAQGDHPLGVERQEADGEGQHEQPVRDLLAEAGAGGPLGVDVLRMSVAGEVGELEDVRLADRPAGRLEPVAGVSSWKGRPNRRAAAAAMPLGVIELSTGTDSAGAPWPSRRARAGAKALAERAHELAGGGAVALRAEVEAVLGEARALARDRVVEALEQHDLVTPGHARQAALNRRIPSSTRIRDRGRRSRKLRDVRVGRGEDHHLGVLVAAGA